MIPSVPGFLWGCWELNSCPHTYLWGKHLTKGPSNQGSYFSCPFSPFLFHFCKITREGGWFPMYRTLFELPTLTAAHPRAQPSLVTARSYGSLRCARNDTYMLHFNSFLVNNCFQYQYSGIQGWMLTTQPLSFSVSLLSNCLILASKLICFHNRVFNHFRNYFHLVIWERPCWYFHSIGRNTTMILSRLPKQTWTQRKALVESLNCRSLSLAWLSSSELVHR